MFFLPIRPELCCVALPLEQPSSLSVMTTTQRRQKGPFSIAESNNNSIYLYTILKASPNIAFGLSSGVHQRQFNIGNPVWQVEDLRINSLWQHKSEYFGLSMQTKLPNTKDTPLAGTDETDWSALIFAQWPREHHRLVVGSGLAIWGDPKRFASQDDALLFIAKYIYEVTSWSGQIGIGGNMASPQNPAQTSLTGGAEIGTCISAKGSVNFGLTSDAPLFGGTIGIEYTAKACTSNKGD